MLAAVQHDMWGALAPIEIDALNAIATAEGLFTFSHGTPAPLITLAQQLHNETLNGLINYDA